MAGGAGLASPRRERQGSFNALGEINIGVRVEPHLVDGGDNLRWVFTFDTETLPRDGTDIHANKFSGAVAIHELMTRLLHLNGPHRLVV